MLTINDLKNKMVVTLDGAPFQILEVKHLHMGRGGSSVQTRIKNLLTGHVFARNFKPSDSFAEADIEKRGLVFLYHHRGEFVFAVPERPSERFTLREQHVEEAKSWLKPQTPVTALLLAGKILAITVPIKMDLAVVEAPPGLRGDTVSGTTKAVIVETGATIQTPLFINEGDVIRVNTETGEYVERVEKSK